MKKLLLLGISNDTEYVLNYCKTIGVYTIITDYNSPKQQPIKRKADEYWMINLTEIDVLEEKCRKEHIDGIFGAANNEFTLTCALELTSRLGLPHYASKEGWTIACDKNLFKEKCIEAGLTVPKEYNADSFDPSHMDFPVIVKPSDGYASQGITVCRKKEELPDAITFAKEFSQSKQVLIEDYIEGIEFTVYFWAEDGEIYLRSFTEGMRKKEHKNVGSGLSKFYSSYYDEFIKQELANVKKFFQLIHWQNGPIFMQCIRNEGRYYWYEANARICGLGIWGIEKYIHGYPMLESLVRYQLGMDQAGDVTVDINQSGKYAIIVVFLCHSGTIGRIVGYDEIVKIPGVSIGNRRFMEGEKISDTFNMRQHAAYIGLVADSPEELHKKLDTVNDTLHYYDVNGHDMLSYLSDWE